MPTSPVLALALREAAAAAAAAVRRSGRGCAQTLGPRLGSSNLGPENRKQRVCPQRSLSGKDFFVWG